MKNHQSIAEMARELIGWRIDEGINDPHIFKALFTAGAPASGKSFVSDQAVAGLGLKLVNSDAALERLLKKANLPLVIDEPDTELGMKQAAIRSRAKSMTSKLQGVWLQGMLGLLIDGTGRDYKKIARQAQMLKDIGYDVGMIFVNTTLETSLKRNKIRPRVVPEKIVKGSWHQVHKNIGKFQRFFGPRNFFIIDNNDHKKGSELYAFSVGLRRNGMKWLKRPIENKIGRDKVAKLQATGGKTLADL